MAHWGPPWPRLGVPGASGAAPLKTKGCCQPALAERLFYNLSARAKVVENNICAQKAKRLKVVGEFGGGSSVVEMAAGDGVVAQTAVDTFTESSSESSNISTTSCFATGEFIRFRFEARLTNCHDTDVLSSPPPPLLHRCRFSGLARRKTVPLPPRGACSAWTMLPGCDPDVSDKGGVKGGEIEKRRDEGAWWIGDSEDMAPTLVKEGVARCEVTAAFPMPGSYSVGFICTVGGATNVGGDTTVATSRPLKVEVVSEGGWLAESECKGISSE